MQFTFIDFFIGFFLMNAMPHLIFGLLKIRFFSLFGFSAGGNLAYAFLNVIIALVLFHLQYGLPMLMSQGFIIGAIAMFLLHLVLDQFFYKLFQQNGGSR